MARTTLGLLLLLLAGCGYVGDTQYPALNIPSRVTTLSAVERGDHLDINFLVPALTTEGLVVKSIGAIDLRVGQNMKDFHIEPWAEAATRIDVEVPKTLGTAATDTNPRKKKSSDAAAPQNSLGTVSTSIPVSKFVGQEVIVAVRLSNSRGRVSEWSNLVTIRVAAPLATPVGVAVSGAPEGVQLKWQASNAPGFRIYRSGAEQTQPVFLAAADKPEYLDTTTVYGKKYDYYVEAVDHDISSDTAGPFSITPADTFAPAIPTGLTATTGVNAIEISWERNTESDFRGYRVYRALGDAPLTQIADLIDAPNYSDRTAESGKRYRYAVSAVDQAGNESDKSAPVEATLP